MKRLLRLLLHTEPSTHYVVFNELNDGERTPNPNRQDPPPDGRCVSFLFFTLLRLGSWDVN
jgi:hypothetical protein